MGNFVGVWKLDESIYCNKEISGKGFQSYIAGLSVLFCFPSCPETYNGGEKFLSEGDLIAPLNLLSGWQVNWGAINAWPEKLFSVNALVCVFDGEEADVQNLYTNFPLWKEKFNNLVLIDSGKFIKPEQKMPALLQYGNGVYDGLELFMIEENKTLKREINHRALSPIYLQFVSSEQCYDTEKMRLLFENAGSSREIALEYELLIVAYRAVIRHDFRSAIIISATALERSILNKIQCYYIDNQLTTFENDKEKHKMLGREFGWLNELGIAIPVHNYVTEILDVRNSVTHEGEIQNYNDTAKYLDRCKLIIQEYSSDVLE